MDNSEYKEIESRALNIVSTLNALKEEIAEYKQAKTEANRELNSLDNLVNSITSATNELAETARQIGASDYRVFYEELFADITSLSENCSSLEAQTKSLPESLKGAIAEQSKKQDESRNAFLVSLDERLQAETKSIESLREKITSVCTQIDTHASELPDLLSGALAEHAKRQKDRDSYITKALERMVETNRNRDAKLLERIENLEVVISRIDRNTQKGFGKEKG